MCTKADCAQYVGKWVSFRTQYGYHVGLVERVTNNSAIMVSPRKHIPTQFASMDVNGDEQERLDLALAWWGGPAGRGYPGAGFGQVNGMPGAGMPGMGMPGAGAYGRFGGRGGFPGYGGGGFGWGRWAVSFLIIYVLWGLLWW